MADRSERVLTVDKARQALADVFTRQGFDDPSGLIQHGDCGFEFGGGVWGCETRIDLHERGDKVRTYNVNVNWSSTRRTVSQATVAIANYQKALTLAAELQAVIEGFPKVVETLEKGQVMA